MILSTIQTPTDSPTNCHRCSSRLTKTYPADFPSCPTCGWEDYSPATTPVQMRGSSIDTLTNPSASRLRGMTRLPRRKT